MAPHAYIPTYSNIARQFIFLISFLKLYYIEKSDFTFFYLGLDVGIMQ